MVGTIQSKEGATKKKKKKELNFISHQTPKEREALPFDIQVHIAKTERN